MKKLRIAVVGVGSAPETRSGGHLDTLLKLSDRYDFCAMVDLDEGRLKEAGERWGVKARYTDLDHMLEQEKPDVVYRLTPTDSTGMVCIKAAEAGCHIINEIPIAITLEMADAIIDACRRNNVKLEIAENVWLWPDEQLKQKTVKQGLLGKITHARLKYPCGAYHGFNAIRMILGTEPKRVLGYAAEVDVVPQRAYGGDPMERAFWEAGIIEFADGVACIYEMPPKGRKWRHGWDVEGTLGQIYDQTLILLDHEKAGDEPTESFKGEVEYPFRRVYEDIGGEAILSEVRVETDPPVVWRNPYKHLGITGEDQIAKAAILDSMHRAVTEDTAPVYGADNGRRDYELWIALRESALRGSEWVELPLTETTELERRFNAEYERKYGFHPVRDIDELTGVPFTRASVIWTVAGWL